MASWIDWLRLHARGIFGGTPVEPVNSPEIRGSDERGHSGPRVVDRIEPIKFSLSQRSLNNLKGVHPALVSVVHRAIQLTPIDFVVSEGLRTKARQRVLFESGATRTMNSRHLTGHAVDLAAWVGGEVRYDWPLYDALGVAMKQAAKELDVDIVWGGDWTTFKDGPHFELNRLKYPA